MTKRQIFNTFYVCAIEVVCFVAFLPIACILRLKKRRKIIQNMNIFIGINEIAGNLYKIESAFKEYGAQTYSTAIRNSYYPNYVYSDEITDTASKLNIFGGLVDINCMRHLGYLFFCIKSTYKICFKYDMAFFDWNLSFFIFNLDWLLFKISGIKVLVMHCGDDVRYRPIHNKIQEEIYGSGAVTLPATPDLSTKYYFLAKLVAQKTAEWFSNFLLTVDDDNINRKQTFLQKNAYGISQPQEILIAKPKKVNEIITILHAPSDRKNKGTDDTVLPAIKALQDEGFSFNFELIENKPNEYVLERLKNADIVIDNPHRMGNLSREALASSCYIITGEMNVNSMWQDCPYWIFKTQDITRMKQGIAECLNNKPLLEQKMQQSWNFANTLLSNHAFCNKIQNVLKGAMLPEVKPLVNQKKLCLKYAGNYWEKFWILLLM